MQGGSARIENPRGPPTRAVLIRARARFRTRAHRRRPEEERDTDVHKGGRTVLRSPIPGHREIAIAESKTRFLRRYAGRPLWNVKRRMSSIR